MKFVKIAYFLLQKVVTETNNCCGRAAIPILARLTYTGILVIRKLAMIIINGIASSLNSLRSFRCLVITKRNEI